MGCAFIVAGVLISDLRVKKKAAVRAKKTKSDLCCGLENNLPFLLKRAVKINEAAPSLPATNKSSVLLLQLPQAAF